MFLKNIESRSFTRCCSCGESIRTCERLIIVVDESTGRPVKGERYCPWCASYAARNNNVVTVSTEATIDPDSQSERRLLDGAYRSAESQGFAESH
jgi:hypothetical protein